MGTSRPTFQPFQIRFWHRQRPPADVGEPKADVSRNEIRIDLNGFLEVFDRLFRILLSH
jgi:hypothetical protein